MLMTDHKLLVLTIYICSMVTSLYKRLDKIKVAISQPTDRTKEDLPRQVDRHHPSQQRMRFQLQARQEIRLL